MPWDCQYRPCVVNDDDGDDDGGGDDCCFDDDLMSFEPAIGSLSAFHGMDLTGISSDVQRVDFADVPPCRGHRPLYQTHHCCFRPHEQPAMLSDLVKKVSLSPLAAALFLRLLL